MERRIPSVLGNHELAATDSRYLEWFNPVARESSLITHRLLSEEALNFMRQLKPSLELDALWFVHGFPPDSPTTYLYEVEDHQIISVVRQLNRDIIFIGHTHEPALIAWDGEKLSHHPLKRGTRRLDPQNRYMLNVGSVGQPRDGDHHAKYVIYDSNRHMIELRYVAYDIARAAQKIIAAGLPRQYAERLG